MRMRSSARCPAADKVPPRTDLSTNEQPTARSSSCSNFVLAGWLMRSTCAAAVREPVVATKCRSLRWRTRSKSMRWEAAWLFRSSLSVVLDISIWNGWIRIQ